MHLAEFLRDCAQKLTALYPAGEARNMALLLCMDRLGIRSYTPVTEPDMELSVTQLSDLVSDVERLLCNEPLQYVLGKAPFYGRDFKVGPGVLIPRPETEILIEEALREPFSSALDICTGSGCIAWTLALERPDAKVKAVDVSGAALEIARSQAPGEAEVDFIEGDVLEEPGIDGPFELIVSNPPYIMDSERAQMRRNVLDYEPSLALFVRDEDPLVFYRAVAHWCSLLLSPGGRGIVEINERLGAQTAALFRQSGFADVSIIRDLVGRERVIRFRKGTRG